VFTGEDIDETKIVRGNGALDVQRATTKPVYNGFLITSDRVDVDAAAHFVCEFLARANRSAKHPTLPVGRFKRVSFPDDLGNFPDAKSRESVVAIEAECFSLELADNVRELVDFCAIAGISRC